MRYYITCFLILCSVAAFSQTAFQPVSFAAALIQAKNEGKLVFLQYESATCNQCNEVANKAFEDLDLTRQLQQTFVCLKVSPSHPDRATVAALYNQSAESFGSLFITPEKTLIHTYAQSATMAAAYKKQVDIALEKAGESLKVNELEREYKAGNKSTGIMEMLLHKKKTLNLPTDTLLNEYVALLPEDSLKSIRTLQFIAQMAPALDSKADKALRKDPQVFTKAWYSMSLPERIGINNVVIYKSMNKAIREKSEAQALRTAAFAQSTHNTNYAAATKAYDMNMLQFYEATADTSKFFTKSIAYYERYFMNVSVDSINKTDSLNRRRMFDNAKKDTVYKDGKKVLTASVGYAPITQNYSRELNNGAWKFYKMTGNPYLLSIATEWSRKALAFYVTPEALDTFSKLLYKQGSSAPAIEAQTRAIALKKQRGFPVQANEITLEKMKAGARVID